eukprot:m.2096 g.2096  ORF g.2096 m.2096 type:complete len:800 (+) comp8278_c0_seq1:27-2426(+)
MYSMYTSWPPTATLFACLLYVVGVASTPSKRTPLEAFISHYEPLTFNGNHPHGRVRRSDEGGEVLRLDFSAHNRNFSLRLRPDYRVFHPRAEFVSISSKGERKIPFDRSSIKMGHAHGHPRSLAHGRLLDGGIFDGIVHLSDESFFIEPSRKYFRFPQPFDAVIFKSSDVNFEHAHHPHNATHCAGTESLYKKMRKIQNSAQLVDTPTRGKRADASEDRTTCYIHLAADHLFYEDVAGSSEADAVSEMTIHLNDADDIYRKTDFLGERVSLAIARVTVFTDPNQAGYKFGSSAIKVADFLDLWSQENQDAYCLAMMFTYRDFAKGVLGLAWIGSAGGGAGGICQKQVRLASGKRSLNTGIVTFVNFGANVPRMVSTVTVAHEFGHNFGSNHDPNTAQCSPGSSNGGNYIMYARATDGDERNNDKFSQCSISEMSAVIKAKGSLCFKPSFGSFCGNKLVEPGEECDCGFTNECDSVDPCCTPYDSSATVGSNTPCTIRRDKGYECSPMAGKCCTDSCKIKPVNNIVPCGSDQGCKKSSYCNGTSPNCPTRELYPDGKPCNSLSNTCIRGECMGSICAVIGYKECLCVKNKTDCAEGDARCHVCCQKDEKSTCISTFCSQLQALNGNLTGVVRSSGKSCANYEGYCDASGKCQGVDNEEVLKTLNKILFSSEGLNKILQWMKDNWIVIIGIVVGIALICALLHLTYKRKKPIRNLARKAARSLQRKKDKGGAAGKKDGVKERKKKEEGPPKKADPGKTLVRLRNMFPRAQPDALKDVMYHSPSEEAAVTKLLAMGFLMRRW